MNLLFYWTGAITIYLFFIIICLTFIVGVIAAIVRLVHLRFFDDLLRCAKVFYNVPKKDRQNYAAEINALARKYYKIKSDS